MRQMTPGNLFGKTYTIYLTLVCIFGVVCFFHPDGLSLWLDELHTVSNTYHWGSFNKLFWGNMVYDGNPPLYQTFMYVWAKLFGVSEYAVRFPSAVFAGASVLFAFFYGRKILGTNQALLLSAFLAILWGSIRYAHEARNYSLLLMLSIILMLQSQKLFSTFRKNILPTKALIYLSITGILLCYTHFFGALIYFSSLLALLFFLKTSRKKIAFTAFISIMIYLPWLILFLSHHGVTQAFWISKRPMIAYYEILRDFAVYNQSTSIIIWIFIFILFILQSAKARKKIFKNISFPATVLLIASGVALLINSLKPLIIERYLIVFLPYIYLILSTIFSEALNIKTRKSWNFVKFLPHLFSVVILSAMLFNSISSYQHFEKEDWKSAANQIIETQNIDKIYCVGSKQEYLHYLRNTGFDQDRVCDVYNFDMRLFSKPVNKNDVSVLWSSHNIKHYHSLKDSLSANSYEIIEEYAYKKNIDTPVNINNSKVLFFR